MLIAIASFGAGCAYLVAGAIAYEKDKKIPPESEIRSSNNLKKGSRVRFEIYDGHTLQGEIKAVYPALEGSYYQPLGESIDSSHTDSTISSKAYEIKFNRGDTLLMGKNIFRVYKENNKYAHAYYIWYGYAIDMMLLTLFWGICRHCGE